MRCATGAPSESRLFFFVLDRAIFRVKEDDAMSWMDEAMKDLRPWIGRVRTVEEVQAAGEPVSRSLVTDA